MAATSDSLTVTAVVVTFNSAAVVGELLDSLDEAFAGVHGWELVVVDNDSGDATRDVVTSRARDAQFIQLGRNAGYAAGVNAGVAAARGERAVLVLNPDVRLPGGCVQRMLTELDDPTVGIVAPRIVDRDGTLARSLRRDPTVLRALGEAVLGGRRAGRWALTGEVVEAPSSYDAPANVAWANGSVLLVSRACIDRVGPWDESFFLYCEETDFALRARDAGLHVRYIPDVTVVHLGGESHDSEMLWSLLVTNRWRLFARRHGRLSSLLFRTALLTGEGVRAIAGRRTSRAAFSTLLRASAGSSLSPHAT